MTCRDVCARYRAGRRFDSPDTRYCTICDTHVGKIIPLSVLLAQAPLQAAQERLAPETQAHRRHQILTVCRMHRARTPGA